jgi:hypothetical protein
MRAKGVAVIILILGIALVITFFVGYAFSFIVCCAYSIIQGERKE